MHLKLITACLLLFLIVACGSGSSGEKTNTQVSEPVFDAMPDTVQPISEPITISGQLTYDFVPVKTGIVTGLDYNNTQLKPMRSVVVQATDAQNTVLSVTSSDEQGKYAIDVPKNTAVTIRVNSSISNTVTNPRWSSTVFDNTQNNQVYTLTRDIPPSDEDIQNVDIHAQSGWGISNYTGAREAGPFAILDSLLEGFQFIEQFDPELTLPKLFIKWSTSNRPVEGEISDGNIRTSTYNRATNTIFLLGLQDVDTDEYDRDVILHEFYHFLETYIFKSNSIGGPHSQTDILDLRVAFSEGVAQAFPGMVLNKNAFTDTSGPQQIFGDTLRLEDEFNVVGDISGWFSRNAVHLLMYDLFDNNQDAGDVLSLGFEPIYRVLTSDAFKSEDALITVYKFADVLARFQPELLTELNEMFAHRGFNTTDSFAKGENFPFDPTRFLPLYLELSPGQEITFCTSNFFGEPNKLDNYKFIKLLIPQPGEATITLSTNDRTIRDIEGRLTIYNNSDMVDALTFNLNRTQSQQRFNFNEAGTYVLTYHESDKVDQKVDDQFPECVDLSVSI